LTQRRVDHPRKVGTLYNKQDFTGNVMIILCISAFVHSQNDAIDDVAGVIIGGGVYRTHR